MEEARKALDRLDSQIASLFCKRLEVIDRIAEIKLREQTPVFVPKREEAVKNRLLEENGDFYQKELLALYEKIFELSRARQEEQMRLKKGLV